jgi:dTDP-4-dehydrorhamnose 3,5-epimerase-like enzyme
MKNLKITKLTEIKNDERGASYEFSTHLTKDFLFVSRKKGTISGEHYHEGKSKQKDPETLVLIKGEFILEAKDLKTGETLKTTVEAPRKLEIGTNVWHKVTALSDITFLETNSLAQHMKDTVQLSEAKLK